MRISLSKCICRVHALAYPNLMHLLTPTSCPCLPQPHALACPNLMLLLTPTSCPCLPQPHALAYPNLMHLLTPTSCSVTCGSPEAFWWWWCRPHPVHEHAQDLRPPIGARPASPPTCQAAQLPPRGPSTNPRPLV